MGLNFPKNPTVGQTYTFGSNIYKWDGDSWESAAAISSQAALDAVNSSLAGKLAAANPSVNGSINIVPGAAGDGIKIDSQYSWVDLIGDLTPKTNGNSIATWDTFRSNFKSWAHPLNTTGDLQYHVPHEYATGTDVFLHLHWGHQGTNIAGTLTVELEISVVPRTLNNPAAAMPAPVTITITVPDLTITNSPQYCMRVDEIQISSAGGVNGLLNTADISVDSLVFVRYLIKTIPSISGGIKNVPFIFNADLHIQSNIIGTKNKDPNFYA